MPYHGLGSKDRWGTSWCKETRLSYTNSSIRVYADQFYQLVGIPLHVEEEMKDSNFHHGIIADSFIIEIPSMRGIMREREDKTLSTNIESWAWQGLTTFMFDGDPVVSPVNIRNEVFVSCS